MATLIAGRVVTILDADNKRFKRAIKSTNKELEKVEKKAGKAGKELNDMFKFAVRGAIIAGVGKIAKDSIVIAANFEQIKTSMRTIIGDAGQADILISQIEKMGSVTPFLDEQLFKASKTLLAFGFTTDRIIPTLRLLGDVSAGTGKDIGELALIFGQIRNEGKLTGERLNQLSEAGFNPLRIMAERTGTEYATLRKEMSKGLITFRDVEQAFVDATGAGGMFNKAMEEQSKTFLGRVSTLRAEVGKLQRELGESLVVPLTVAVEKLTEFVRLYNLVQKGGGTPAEQAKVLAGVGVGTAAVTALAIKAFMPQKLMTLFESLGATRQGVLDKSISGIGITALVGGISFALERALKVREASADVILQRGLAPDPEASKLMEENLIFVNQLKAFQEEMRRVLEQGPAKPMLEPSEELLDNLKRAMEGALVDTFDIPENLEKVWDELFAGHGFTDSLEDFWDQMDFEDNMQRAIEKAKELQVKVAAEDDGRFSNALAGAFKEGSIEAHRAIVQQDNSKARQKELSDNAKELVSLMQGLVLNGVKLDEVGLAQPTP